MMKDREIIEILGNAFANGEVDALTGLLSDDCEYVSDYSGKKVTSAEKIIKCMKEVYDCITDESRYNYRIVDHAGLLREDGLVQMPQIPNTYPDEKALLLYQYSKDYPCAVVSVARDRDSEKIKSILLSRDSKIYDVSFYEEECGEDSPLDLPSTVAPLTTHDRHVKELRSAFSGQHLDDVPEEIKGDLYIWKKADEYIKSWLDGRGYKVLESQSFDDCIGYRCNRKNYAYTVFMYAYGQKKTAQLDGDYCKKLIDYELSKNSTVLVVYVNVRRVRTGSEIVYKIGNYCGSQEYDLELWRLNSVAGKNILEYYPRKEMMDATYKLMYAFNHDCLDVYDTIICEKGPAFHGISPNGIFMNSAFFTSLHRLHEQYGDMKIGYVRYNDVIYSSTPYIDGYGFFSFRVDNNTDRILEATAYPFEGGEKKVAEYIKTDERESDAMYDRFPQLKAVSALPAVPTERFALKLLFENGECRKYVLPIPSADEDKEVLQYKQCVFTDRIWQSATVKESLPAEISGYAERKSVVVFKNGFFLSYLLCYLESTPYVEPEKCDDVVFEDEHYRLSRVWKWGVKSAYRDKETGLLKILLSGDAFNYYGVSTFATIDGERLTSIDFDYIDSFSDGLARVAKAGYGYGFVDERMNFVIPMNYENAEDFVDGKAKVKRNGEWYYIDKTGKETLVTPKAAGTQYQEVGQYFEGMCKVSTLKLCFTDLAYHSDYEEIAGTWGFVNEAGEEVIAPQYIYAEDFSGGIAIVCKGKWTIDPKWDNEYNKGLYWTDEELWGAIDKDGNTAIPFVFDEIKHFWAVEGVFMAHYGGWENGHWGVIDAHGNWLADPVFEDIDYEYHDGLFAFYKEDKWNGGDVPLGIYDIKQHKVIFEPQFYDVSFHDDGWIKVEVYDETLGRRVEKLIDLDGREKFHSIYTSIYTWKKPYEVMIRDECGDRHGLIDEDGNVILPCEYDVVWNGLDYEHKRMVFSENDKQGVRDFSGNIILPPIYHQVRNIDRPFYTIQVGTKEDHTEGLITDTGREILPSIYKELCWYGDNYLLCKGKNGIEMMVLTEKRKA